MRAKVDRQSRFACPCPPKLSFGDKHIRQGVDRNRTWAATEFEDRTSLQRGNRVLIAAGLLAAIELSRWRSLPLVKVYLAELTPSAIWPLPERFNHKLQCQFWEASHDSFSIGR